MSLHSNNTKITSLTNLVAAFIVLLTAALTLSSAEAAWYAKFDGVDGSSKQKDHDKWINVDSFSSKAGGGGTGVGRVGGKMHLEDISLGIISDKATPKLLEAAAKGKVFKKVEIHGTATYGDAGEQTYLAVELKNAQISSYSLHNSTPTTEGADFLTEVLGAGNFVFDSFDANGVPTGRDVQSFRIDPATGLADFDFVDPAIPYAGGFELHTMGTPDYRDEDSDGDGLADRLVLTSLSSSGVDGFTTHVGPAMPGGEAVRVPLSLIHGDVNPAIIVGRATSFTADSFSFGVEREMKSSGAAGGMPGDLGTVLTHSFAYGKDGKKGGNVEFEWKVEEGESLVEVARGIATADDLLILTSFTPSSDIPTESVSINYNKIQWSYRGISQATLPGAGNVPLDPTQKTTLTLQVLGAGTGALADISLGFGNFDQAIVGRLAAVPEPATLGLLLASMTCVAMTRRCKG